MPIPSSFPAPTGALQMPSLRGEQFFNSPPRYSGPVRLYSDTDYLKSNISIQKVTGGGISVPFLGGANLSRLTTLEMGRYYEAVGKLPLTTLANTGTTLEEEGRIIINVFEPAWKIEWGDIGGRKFAAGVFHTRNVATKRDLQKSEWTHILVDLTNIMVTLDTFFSNSQRIEIVATRKNELMTTHFGESDYYLILRYAEYRPEVGQETHNRR